MWYLKRGMSAKLDDQLSASRLLGFLGFMTRLHTILFLIVVGLLSGCGGIPSIGLQPENPLVEKGSFKLWGEFVEVDSLQPTLRWQPFPRAEDRNSDKEGNLDRVENVSYQLRVWKTVRGYSGRLVYARDGLTTPYHELDRALEPSSRYLWTVRARFVLDGLPQVTEWGLAGYLLRGDVIPNPSCFRFITPKSPGETRTH
jgi:hypothetical protein